MKRLKLKANSKPVRAYYREIQTVIHLKRGTSIQGSNKRSVERLLESFHHSEISDSPKACKARNADCGIEDEIRANSFNPQSLSDKI